MPVLMKRPSESSDSYLIPETKYLITYSLTEYHLASSNSFRFKNFQMNLIDSREISYRIIHSSTFDPSVSQIEILNLIIIF